MTQDASHPGDWRAPISEDMAPHERLARKIRWLQALMMDLDSLRALLAADLPEPDAEARLTEAKLVAVSALFRDVLSEFCGQHVTKLKEEGPESLLTEQALLHRLVRRHGWTVTAPGVIERRPTGHV